MRHYLYRGDEVETRVDLEAGDTEDGYTIFIDRWSMVQVEGVAFGKWLDVYYAHPDGYDLQASAEVNEISHDHNFCVDFEDNIDLDYEALFTPDLITWEDDNV